MGKLGQEVICSACFEVNVSICIVIWIFNCESADKSYVEESHDVLCEVESPCVSGVWSMFPIFIVHCRFCYLSSCELASIALFYGMWRSSSEMGVLG